MTRAAFALLSLLIAACAPAPAAGVSVSPVPSATAAPPTATQAPSPSPSQARTLGENPILGYRITLPGTYRAGRSAIFTDRPEMLGQDMYTFDTEAQERAECLRDAGDIPSPSAGALLLVIVYRNVAGASPVDWARRRPENIHHSAEPATINGLPAAKLVQLGGTVAYVIAANDRMYEISPTMLPSQHPLDAIAGSFRAIAPSAFPTATPASSVSPRDAAAEMARSLAAAFAAKDADAIARLITPSCWLGFGATVNGTPTGGAVNRAVANFMPALRERFASNDLTVKVDQTLQVDPRSGTPYFVRSQWIESDRTTAIDLWLSEVDGAWRWTGAMHYYDRSVETGCIPYRSPWITPTPGSCSP